MPDVVGRADTNKQRPHTDIQPDGAAWYTVSPLADQVSRYALVVRRYTTFLAEDDPARAEVSLVT